MLRPIINDVCAFTPEDVRVLIAAFEDTLRELDLADREDPITLIVAKHVIECAKEGERDPTRLRDLAMKCVTSNTCLRSITQPRSRDATG